MRPYFLAGGLLALAVMSSRGAAVPALVPMPTKYESAKEGGTFAFTGKTMLASKEALGVARNFAAPLKLRVLDRDEPHGTIYGGTITVLVSGKAGKNAESYTMDVTPAEVRIEAASAAGAFYALETLRQLMPGDVEKPLEYRNLTEPLPSAPREEGGPPSPGEPGTLDKAGRTNPPFAAPPQYGEDGKLIRQIPPTRPGKPMKAVLPMFAVREGMAVAVPCCHIEDSPRYSWRGVLLDTSRHFFSKEYVLKYIDTLALHKMNVLHWHLCDDQGWRLEILQYPKLTEVAAFRSREEPPPRPRNPATTKPGTTTQPISETTMPAPEKDEHYGGFYTQDDVREIVAYAAARQVMIVPEIEMPGHCTAVLAAYPELACTAGPFQVSTHWGVHADVYCPRDTTFEFLENVLDEVCELFPSPYIHIGGDEVPKDRWKASPECQGIIRDQKLKDEHELQAYFVQRIGNYLVNQKHKRFIGWDEILEGGLAPGAVVQSWRGMGGGKAAAAADHDVIMAPQSHCYLDHAYEPSAATANKRGSDSVALDKVYNFDPTPPDVTAEQAKHILGAEGTVWAERIPTPERADYMTYPRACALAEALWTAPAMKEGRRDFTEFAARLREHFQQMRSLNITFYDDPVASAAVAGSWKPGDFQKEKSTREFDVSDAVKEAGTYTVRVNLLNGQHKLDLFGVSLTEDGKEIAGDPHAGSAGTTNKGTIYTLNVPAVKAGSKYALHLTAAASTGPDTFGEILVSHDASK